eukprot:3934654-Rhodomonas_salina.1
MSAMVMVMVMIKPMMVVARTTMSMGLWTTVPVTVTPPLSRRVQMIKNHPEWANVLSGSERARRHTKTRTDSDHRSSEHSTGGWAGMGLVEFTALVLVGLCVVLMQLSPGMH